jgi:transcriptional regulator with XRE-family HTH domain
MKEKGRGKMDSTKLGTFLKEKREALELSTRDVQTLTGYSKTNINKLELGIVSNVNMSVVLKLMSCYRMKSADIAVVLDTYIAEADLGDWTHEKIRSAKNKKKIETLNKKIEAYTKAVQDLESGEK